MNLISICTWTGSNFGEIVNKISEVNTEAMIRILGKRIIIQDKHADFYQNVVVGDMVEIPVYPECLICDEVEDEAYIQPKYSSEVSDELAKEWGLS